MKEVYIISRGCYSDYHIERVFLDKEKAEKYYNIRGGEEVEDFHLEIYETSDDDEIREIKYVEVSYHLEDKHWVKAGEYSFKVVSEVESEYCGDISYVYDDRIVLNRSISLKNFKEETLKNKYKKFCEELAGVIKYEQEVNNASDDDIDELLNNRIELVDKK